MRLILLGAPGAGKGTQAEVICKHLRIPAISTGNIIREALANQTELGMKTKSYMDAGRLVPDEIIISMVKERLNQPDCENGFILDGMPRTIAQAEALDAMGIAIDRVIDIEVPDETIERRLAGRRVCKDCSASYHLDDKPSKIPGVCDNCGGELIVRKDDDPKIIRERLKIYHDQTEPLKDYYRNQNKLVVVVGQEKVEDTTRLTLQALEAVL